MAIYEYEHIEAACPRGRIFEAVQSIHDDPFEVCPDCGGPVRRLISLVGISTPKTNSELRDLGFTKLVKRDDGVTRTSRPARAIAATCTAAGPRPCRIFPKR